MALCLALSVAPSRTGARLAAAPAAEAQDYRQLLRLANQYSDQAEWAKAADCFRSARRCAPQPLSKFDLVRWSFAARKAGLFDEAIAVAQWNFDHNRELFQLAELGWCYADAHRPQEARTIISRELRNGQIPTTRDSEVQLRALQQQIAVNLWRYPVQMLVSRYPYPDIRENILREHRYDILIPVDTASQQCRVSLSNVLRRTTSVDNVGNVRWSLVPEDWTKPVTVTFYFRTCPLSFDLTNVGNECFSVPTNYKCYTTKTDRLDPDGPNATRVAAEVASGRFAVEAGMHVDPTTTYGKLLNLWLWSKKIAFAPVPATGSEETIAVMTNTCKGQAYAASAVARHLGFAARPVGGFSNIGPDQQPLGHTWYEIYLPGVIPGWDWVPFQTDVRMGDIYWNCVRYFVEATGDLSTWTPLVNYRDEGGRPIVRENYINTVFGVFCDDPTSRVAWIDRSFDDLSLDDYLRGRGIEAFRATDPAR